MEAGKVAQVVSAWGHSASWAPPHGDCSFGVGKTKFPVIITGHGFQNVSLLIDRVALVLATAL